MERAAKLATESAIDQKALILACAEQNDINLKEYRKRVMKDMEKEEKEQSLPKKIKKVRSDVFSENEDLSDIGK